MKKSVPFEMDTAIVSYYAQPKKGDKMEILAAVIAWRSWRVMKRRSASRVSARPGHHVRLGRAQSGGSGRQSRWSPS